MTHQRSFADAYSPIVVETLSTILVPGKRARVSPFIESAQFRVLFNRAPVPQRRNEDARKILKEHEADIEDLARCWAEFHRRGKKFTSQIYTEAFLRAYLAYYLTTNVCKVQLVLLELVRQQKLSGSLVLMDVGVGAGTTPVAVLDFLVAWSNVCDLYDVEFPLSTLRIIGLDVNERCLKFAATLLQAYAEALQERIRTRSEKIKYPDVLEKAVQWARGATWRCVDLNNEVPELPSEPTLLVASNVLNELEPLGRRNLQRAIAGLPTGSMAIVIEPGDRGDTQRLNRWRCELLDMNPNLTIIAPCGQEHRAHVPGVCGQCWNARQESLHQPLLYRSFRWFADSMCKDRRSFDEFENRLLSWSYVCVQAMGSSAKSACMESTRRSTCRGLSKTLVARYIGTFNSREPLAYDPDNITHHDGWKKFIKLCPIDAGLSLGDVHYAGFCIERKLGFEIPPLRHGDKVVVHDVAKIVKKEVRKKNIAYSEPTENTRIDVLGNKVKLGYRDIFLRRYTVRTRKAIDEIVYRLFGFPAMYPFQHRVLERVLMGKSILAIAATGGGKSECFILPAMLLPGITIVVSPLKSLMQDQYDRRICHRYGLNHLATYINGDVSFRERQARLKRMEMGYYKLVYMTPEQLERGYVLDSLKRADEKVGVRYIALDEAHCISQWGHDFRPSYLNLVHRLRTWGINPVRIALTATASPYVRDDVCEELDLNPASIEEGGDVYVFSSNRPELNLIVRVMHTTEDKVNAIVDDLRHLLRENEHNQYPGAAIVFMPHTGGDPDNRWRYLPQESADARRGRLSAGVTPFASYLERTLSRRVAIYHSKMDSDEDVASEQADDASPVKLGDLSGRGRRSEQDAFIKGEREIMVATKGFGMGIDKPNIRLIIHRTPPANLEAYAQEAGRAGRDGELADVILYYSPDRPADRNAQESQWLAMSDYEIQAFFLSRRYIRRQDVIVMRAFLKRVKHRVGNYLYFTNDEAIEFFDDCISHPELASMDEPYSWPEFPERERKSYESDEHAEILDRGHLYEQKTAYIERILSALYRIRPDLPAGQRLALLEKVQETGTLLVGPKVKNAEAILSSNAYFGALLRDKGLTAEELQMWVYKCSRRDFLEFADRLGLSPSETAMLFGDIKNADGRFDTRGRWVPALMDFRFIVAPKYGPAAGRTTLKAWRDYAGARTRATKSEAYARALKRNRSRPTLDDWFSDREVPWPKGWEVLPGPAFGLDEEFEQYLDAFMELHDRRKENDWRSYQLLLTDYLGVSEDGQLRSRQERNCLRSVLLGYLKSNEVVVGDNCYSCSRCVPNENFERDIEKRRSIVISLSPAVAKLLSELETYVEALPSKELTDTFWSIVEAEQQSGRSLIGYVTGWTGRLLLDTPGHRAALWLRVTGMVWQLMPVEPNELVSNARQLVAHCSDVELRQVWDVLSSAHEIVPETPEIYAVQAQQCHRLALYDTEELKWKRVIDLGRGREQLLHEAHAGLAALYRSDGPLPNQTAYATHSLEAARTALDPQSALIYYCPLVANWQWELVQHEVSLVDQRGIGERLGPQLIEFWLTSHLHENGFLAVTRFLDESKLYLRWPEPLVARILNRIPLHVLALFHGIASWWLAIQAPSLDKESELLPFAELATDLVIAGGALSPDVITKLGYVLFDWLPEASSEALSRKYFANPEQLQKFLSVLIEDYIPHSTEALSRWLQWFTPTLTASHPNFATKVLHLTTERVNEYSDGNRLTACSKLQERLKGALAYLLMQADLRPAAHGLLLALARYWPEELATHLARCLSWGTTGITMAEECLEAIIQRENHELLNQVSQVVKTNKLSGRSERINRVIVLFDLLSQYETHTGINTSKTLTPEHFKGVMKIFRPMESVDRADMAAALIEHLCRYTNPRWLTPISYHVEALGYAGRYAEADRLVTIYPELQVRGQPARAFLYRLSLEPRLGSKYELDYQRVTRVIAKRWPCCN